MNLIKRPPLERAMIICNIPLTKIRMARLIVSSAVLIPLALIVASAPLSSTSVGPVGELTMPGVPLLRPEKKDKAITVSMPAKAPTEGVSL